MEENKERGSWTAVPKFGGWESGDGVSIPTDYSVIFANARENRKQSKIEIHEDHTGNKDQLIAHRSDSHPRRGSFLRYFNCCVKV
eukprot:Gb_01084 [translate_table: standard]